MLLSFAIIVALAPERAVWAQPMPSGFAAPRHPSTSPLDAKALLAELCASHSAEPVCVAHKDLSSDQAWGVLDFACRSNPAAGTSACVTFRPRSGPTLRHDFRTGAWTAQWDGGDYKVDIDVAGTPTLRLRSRDARPLKIVVDDVSPLAYSAEPGTPKEDDLAVISGLKTFLALAGTGLQSAIQSLSFSSVASLGSQLDVTQLLEDAQDKKLVTSFGGGEAEGNDLPPPKETCEIAAPNLLPVADFVTARLRLLADLSARTTALQAQLASMTARRSAFIEAVQAAENGTSVNASDLQAPDVGQLDSAFGDFERATSDLEKQTHPMTACTPLFDAYQVLLGAPPNGSVIATLASRVHRAPACGDSATMALASSIRDNALLLADSRITKTAVCSADAIKRVMELHRDSMKPLVDRITGALKTEEKVWAAVDKARESRPQVAAGARQLAREVEEGRRHTWGGTLVRSLVVTRQNPKLPWNKVQTHEVVVRADSPFAKELDLAKGAEERRPYKLESATSHVLGYGVGVVYTSLHEPVFGAVARPGGTEKVIAKVSQETRAGALAAFLTFRPMERLRRTRAAQLTVDIGVGLSTDYPAFYIGPAVEFKRVARFGIGWALQRVTHLSSGQSEDVTVVASSDDIRTEKRFDVRHLYAAFSLSFDSLSLFGSK